MYFVHNKLEGFDDNDVCEMKDKVSPGQTFTSIKTFLKSVKGWKSRKSQAYQNQPLHELAQLRLHNKSPNSLCVESSTKTERHIERIKKVVQVYDVLSSQHHLKWRDQIYLKNVLILIKLYYNNKCSNTRFNHQIIFFFLESTESGPKSQKYIDIIKSQKT